MKQHSWKTSSEDELSIGGKQTTVAQTKWGINSTSSDDLGQYLENVSPAPSLISFADEPDRNIHSLSNENDISIRSTMIDDEIISQASEVDAEFNSFEASQFSFAEDGEDSFGAGLISFTEVDSIDEGGEKVNTYTVEKKTYGKLYEEEAMAVSLLENQKGIPKKGLKKCSIEEPSHGLSDSADPMSVATTNTETNTNGDIYSQCSETNLDPEEKNSKKEQIDIDVADSFNTPHALSDSAAPTSSYFSETNTNGDIYYENINTSSSESQYNEINLNAEEKITKKKQKGIGVADSFVGTPHSISYSTVPTSRSASNKKNSTCEDVTSRMNQNPVDITRQRCVGDKSVNNAQLRDTSLIVCNPSNISQNTCASHATTQHSNTKKNVGSHSDEKTKTLTDVDCVQEGAKLRALREITVLFGYDHEQESQAEVQREHDIPFKPIVHTKPQLDIDEMHVMNEKGREKNNSDGFNTNSGGRDNQYEKSFKLSSANSLPTCARHSERIRETLDHSTSIDTSAISQHDTDEQPEGILNSYMQPKYGQFESVAAVTKSEAIMMEKNIYYRSTDECLSSSSSSFEISSHSSTCQKATKLFDTAAYDNSVNRLIVFSIITLFGGFYGSYYAETTCHFATISEYVGYYGTNFKSHVGMWQYSPIDSVFTGYTYCASYSTSAILNPPSSVRILGLLAFLCGTVNMVIVWYYLFFVRTTEFLWKLAWYFALAAGVLQACTLLFFVESICQDNICSVGPGSVASCIASISWFAIVFGMTRRVPSDAITKAISMVENLSESNVNRGPKVEMVPISRSDANKVDARTSMYQAPVLTDDIVLV